MSQNEQRMIALAARPDIFHVDRDRRLYMLMVLALIFGILFGFLLMSMEQVEVSPEYYDVMSQTIGVQLVPEIIPEEIKPEDKKEEKKPKPEDLKQKVLKISKSLGAGPGSGGGVGGGGGKGVGAGDIRERVTQKGLLAIISGKARSGNAPVTSGFTSNSFVSDLDNVLSNIGGLKTAGRSGVGRMGISTGKFNQGYAGNGGGGGIDDLLGQLGGGGGGGSAAAAAVSLTRRANVELPSSKEIFSSTDGLAGRSAEEIYRVVMQHIGGLRSEYNKRLRDKPMLKGKVTVRFTIDPAGRVIACNVVNTTLNDKLLEMAVTSRVKTWQFDACGKCGTATVTYPFAFSQ